MRQADKIVGGVADQNPAHDVDLEGAYQPSAPKRRREFRDVNRPQHGGYAEAHPAENAGCEQHRPADCESRAQSGEDVESSGIAQPGTRTEPLSNHSSREAAQNRADRADGHGQALVVIAQPIEPHHRIDDAGDHCNIESEDKAAQGACQR